MGSRRAKPGSARGRALAEHRRAALGRVVVIHFNPPNLDKRLARVGEYEVETVTPKGPADLKPLRERPPDAFVADLDRRPSEGRSIAVQLRRYASTRPVPLVFAGGAEDQVARVRNLLPDATYVSWQGGLGGVRRATELVEEGPARLVLLFAPGVSELERDFAAAKAAIAPGGTLWTCWPKKASALQSNLDQPTVRRYAMERGLVDFKVAAIDATWSGLRFARQKR